MYERPPLKWFKDNSDTIRSREIIQQKETKEKIETLEKQRNESIILEESEEKLVVEEDIKKKLITEKDLEEKSIVERKLKKETSIEQKLKGLIVDKNLEKKFTLEETLKTETTLDEKFQEKMNILKVKRTITPNKNEECFSCYENSESDYEMARDKSATSPLVKEIDQKFLHIFHTKITKQRSDRELINRVLKNQYFKANRMFDESAKTVPLPRRSGTINITFSERFFPTPARESSHNEEQEVCYIITNFI